MGLLLAYLFIYLFIYVRRRIDEAAVGQSVQSLGYRPYGVEFESRQERESRIFSECAYWLVTPSLLFDGYKRFFPED